jgi:4-hydroxy-2-oxoheptanedioate aldolase
MSLTKEQVLGFWFSSPNFVAAEIAARQGYRNAVLDIEHGSFDLALLDRFIPFARALGFNVMAKVLAPERSPIQQALDFGANAVVIPHIQGEAHARQVAAYAKFPDPKAPGLRERSYAGGRTVQYQGPDAEFFARENAATRCLPMVETPGALAEIEGILALPTVDGVFVGPSDLALRRGRGSYQRNDADWKDIEAIAQAARVAGKPWYMPAWAPVEREVSVRLGVSAMICTMEFGALHVGIEASRKMLTEELSPLG